MAYLLSTNDLLLAALEKAGEQQNPNSPYYALALQHLNTAHVDILSGANRFDVDLCEPWAWAKAQYPGVLTLQPAFKTGGVNLTANSKNASFTNVPTDCWGNQVSVQGYYLQTPGLATMYRIAAHVSGQLGFVLDSVFTDSTVTGLGFAAIPLDYTLTDNAGGSTLLRQIGPMNVYKHQQTDINREGHIEGLDLKSFQLRFPWHRLVQGVPTEFAIVISAQGTIGVRFNKYPFDPTRVEYDYIAYPTDLAASSTSYPLVPQEFREVLADWAAHKILVSKSDSKADYYEQKTVMGLKALVAANRKTVTKVNNTSGVFQPRQDQFSKWMWPTAVDDLE